MQPMYTRTYGENKREAAGYQHNGSENLRRKMLCGSYLKIRDQNSCVK